MSDYVEALPEALRIWSEPGEMLKMWSQSDAKIRREKTIASWIPSNAVVADLGCGIGRMVEYLHADVDYYLGVDTTNAMIETAKHNWTHYDNVSFMSADIFNFVSDDKYDVVICQDVLQHQDKPLTGLHRLLDNWHADAYFVSLLVGARAENLYASTVVPWAEVFDFIRLMNIGRTSIEAEGYGLDFGWLCLEILR